MRKARRLGAWRGRVRGDAWLVVQVEAEADKKSRREAAAAAPAPAAGPAPPAVPKLELGGVERMDGSPCLPNGEVQRAAVDAREPQGNKRGGPSPPWVYEWWENQAAKAASLPPPSEEEAGEEKEAEAEEEEEEEECKLWAR